MWLGSEGSSHDRANLAQVEADDEDIIRRDGMNQAPQVVSSFSPGAQAGSRTRRKWWRSPSTLEQPRWWRRPACTRSDQTELKSSDEPVWLAREV